MRELHLFAGSGGGILGGILLGHTTVCAVEIELYCRRNLLQRQRDGILPRFPIWDDITTFNGKPWRGAVDIIAGGFPCKGISPARTNNHVNGNICGINGGSSELWFEMERVIGEIRPKFVFIENSKNLRTKGLCRILEGLSSMGYNAKWCVLGPRSFGADHIRERMWILATIANSNEPQQQGGSLSSRIHQEDPNLISSDWWKGQPTMERVAIGLASGLDKDWSARLKAIGNGQSPIVAATAWKILNNSAKCPHNESLNSSPTF